MIAILITLSMVFYTSGVVYFATKYYIEKSKVNELKKQLTGQMTDTEILQFIAVLYRKIDLKNINIDMLSDWFRFVDNQILKKQK